jgi:hypothetical protein
MAEILGNYIVSGVCAAFDATAVGSRVLKAATLMDYLDEFVPLHDVAGRGSAMIKLPEAAFPAVLGGDGCVPSHATNADYVMRTWRGETGLYLSRAHALPVTSLHVLAYSRATYLADPDKDATDPWTGALTWDAVNQRQDIEQIEHWLKEETCPETVIVGVFASGLPGPPPLARRALVHNIAGGNAAYLPQTRLTETGDLEARLRDTFMQTAEEGERRALEHDVKLLHAWIAQARATDFHEQKFRVVAD